MNESTKCPKCGRKNYVVNGPRTFMCGSTEVYPGGVYRFMQSDRCRINELEQRVAAMTTRAEAAERDAARFRWILANHLSIDWLKMGVLELKCLPRWIDLQLAKGE